MRSFATGPNPVPTTEESKDCNRSPSTVRRKVFVFVFVFLVKDFPDCSGVKNLLTNAGDIGDVGLTPGSGGFPGEGNDNPFQYSYWKIPRTEKCGGL